jgi:DNA polymerase-3 subunit delta'
MTALAVDPWAAVVGQREALVRLEAAAAAPVHAYLFLGSLGSGSYEAALGFAGLMLAAADADAGVVAGAGGGEVGAAAGGPEVRAERHMRLAIDAKHPDVMVMESEGATLRVSEADEIIRAGLRSPVEGSRKVIVVKGVDAIEEAAIGKLLKVIEEPPASAVFVLLAEEVLPELVTIASRCVTVDFGPVPIEEMQRTLIERGVEPERALVAATAAGGDFGRASLLATDDGLANRAELWREVPDRLDGTGSAVVELVNELRAGMDAAQEPLEARQAGELEQLEQRVEQFGERGSGRAELVARHKREVRRLRSDELRFGLATLSRVYRDRLVSASDPAADAAADLIQATAENLIRNPNEALMLQDLLLRLGRGSDRSR